MIQLGYFWEDNMGETREDWRSGIRDKNELQDQQMIILYDLIWVFSPEGILYV